MRYYIISFILLILVGLAGYALTANTQDGNPSAPVSKQSDDSFKNFSM